MDLDAQGGDGRVFQRLGGQSGNDPRQQKVCHHWRAGRCNRFPCPFLHRELRPPSSSAGANGNASKRAFANDSGFSGSTGTRRGGNFNTASSWGRAGGNKVLRKTEKVCNFWVQGKCAYGDQCKFLHSWNMGDCFTFLTQLDGHQKAVTGIALPSGSDKLYSGSNDDTVRVWDCQSGQCMGVIQLGGEVGCMISEGPWIFVGVPNLVKAWNTQTNADLSLKGPVGQVYALVVGNDLLFSGSQDGLILAWRYNAATSNFEPAASLIGHTASVVSLVVGANRLYSGSMDKSIKVWAATESGNLEVTYTHKEDHGLLTLCGLHDLEGKPILLCSCNDNSVRLLDLPSFQERGKIFAKQEIRAIHTGPGSLFFTGDGTGQVRVWKCVAEPTPAAR